MNRRAFLQIGAGVLVLPLADQLLSSCTSSTAPIHWASVNQSIDNKGSLTIQQLTGKAIVNGVPVEVGATLPAQGRLELLEGQLDAALPDGSVIRLDRGAVLTAELGSTEGGTLRLHQGSLLAAIRKTKRHRYLIRNASAVIGVKGTVFYTEVLSEESYRDPRVPKEATDYFCVCNGKIDYLDSKQETLKSDQASHHSSYFLQPSVGEIAFHHADFLFDHDDRQIRSLIHTMKGKKHSTSWLDANYGRHGY